MKKQLIGLFFVAFVILTGCGMDYSDVPYLEGTVEPKAAETSSSIDYEASIERFDILPKNSGGYYYKAIVEIKNTGSENIYTKGETFDIEDSSGHLIQSDQPVSLCPDVILPGETGYLYTTFGKELSSNADINDIVLNPQFIVKSTGVTPHDYPVNDLSLKEDTYGLTAVGRITNDTEEDVGLLYIQVLYYDYDGKIIGISGTNLTDLLAGRTMSFEISGIGLPDDVNMGTVGRYVIIARDTFYGF